MARQVNFVPGTIVTSNFLNSIQEVESALAIGIRLERGSATTIKLEPAADGSESGQSSLIIDGMPRFFTSTIVKTVEGAKGTYSIYAVAGESTTLEASDVTLTTGAAPANSRKIGEVDWSGTAIERIRQNGMGAVTGAMIEDEALSAGGDLEWTREPSGAWVPAIKASAVTAAKLASNAVEEAKIKDGAVSSRKAKLTAGVVLPTGELLLTEAYADVPGAKLEITPSVASILLVTAIFDFSLTGYAGTVEALGSISVDGEAENVKVAKHRRNYADGAEIEGTFAQTYAVPLTAAKHTIKLRAKRAGEAVNPYCRGNTALQYVLVASKET